MIIIIRALSQVRKGWWRLWFPHKSGWNSGLKIQRKEKWGHKKEKAPKTKKQKNDRKREKGQYYYPFTTLVLQSSTMIFMIESPLCCHFHILVGNFSLHNLACIFQWWASSNCPRSSWASELDAHPLYTYSSSASVAWQSLLTHIDIY